VNGCQDPATAIRRADAFANSVKRSASIARARNDIDEAVIGRMFVGWRIEHMHRLALTLRFDAARSFRRHAAAATT
jgi:hypothetical protein